MAMELGTRMTVRLYVLGRELERIREERGLTDQQIRDGGLDPSGIRRWLSGETTKPRRSTVELALRVFGVEEPLRAELLDLALHPDGPAWLRSHARKLPESYARLITFEAEASEERSFQPLLVPGLLQTEAYTEALARATPGITDEQVRREVDVRLHRQAVLSGPQALGLHVILDEAALRRHVGGPQVMREQLRALVDGTPNVLVQVVPFAAGEHASMTGPFVLMSGFRIPRAPRKAVFVESTHQLFVDSDEALDEYEARWAALVSKALDPQDSAAFIAAAAESIQ